MATTPATNCYCFKVKRTEIKRMKRRNMKIRALIQKHREVRDPLVQIYRFPDLPQVVREAAHKEIIAMGPNSSRKGARSVCTILNRSRGLVRGFRVGRMVYRYYADRAQLAGIQRAKF